MRHLSVSRHIILLKFSHWNIKCFGQKEPINIQFVGLLRALMKVHTIPHAIFETSSSGLLEFRINFHFDIILSLKVYKILANKVQRSHISWHWRVMPNLKKNWFVVSKMTKMWWILIRALKGLKNFHFDWFLLCKVYNIWSKKVQRSYLSWHWCVIENLKKKLSWGLENDMRNSANFYQHTCKCQNCDFDGRILSKVEHAWTKTL